MVANANFFIVTAPANSGNRPYHEHQGKSKVAGRNVFSL
jgi:hypothetical protein